MKRWLAALMILALTNCALISHGTQQTITVTSEPSAAHAVMTCDGQPAGSADTPGTITFKRRHNSCDVVFVRNGFDAMKIILDAAPSRAFWRNFPLIGGSGIATVALNGTNLAGLVAIPVTLAVAAGTLLVDKLSGAYYDWSPQAVHAALITQKSASIPVAAQQPTAVSH